MVRAAILDTLEISELSISPLLLSLLSSVLPFQKPHGQGFQGLGSVGPQKQRVSALGLGSASELCNFEMSVCLTLWPVTQELLTLQLSVLPFWKPHGQGFWGLGSKVTHIEHFTPVNVIFIMIRFSILGTVTFRPPVLKFITFQLLISDSLEQSIPSPQLSNWQHFMQYFDFTTSLIGKQSQSTVEMQGRASVK